MIQTYSTNKHKLEEMTFTSTQTHRDTPCTPAAYQIHSHQIHADMQVKTSSGVQSTVTNPMRCTRSQGRGRGSLQPHDVIHRNIPCNYSHCRVFHGFFFYNREAMIATLYICRGARNSRFPLARSMDFVSSHISSIDNRSGNT